MAEQDPESRDVVTCRECDLLLHSGVLTALLEIVANAHGTPFGG